MGRGGPLRRAGTVFEILRCADILGLLLFLLTDRTHRRWLARPEPYLAAAAALAVFSPVLLWNATHGWASFAFQGDRAAGIGFHPLAPVTTLAGEALFVLPWIWLPMIFLLVRGFRWQAPWTHRLLVWLAAPPNLGFALVSVWSGQRVLYHWAAPGYLMLFPLLGEAIATLRDRAWVRRVVAGTAVLVLAAVTVISTQIQFDWLGSSLATIMHRDPTQEAVDWTTLGNDLRSRGLLPAGTVAAAVNWRDAGKIGYGLGSGVTMLCLCVELETVRLRSSAGRFRRTDNALALARSGRSDNAGGGGLVQHGDGSARDVDQAPRPDTSDSNRAAW